MVVFYGRTFLKVEVSHNKLYAILVLPVYALIYGSNRVGAMVRRYRVVQEVIPEIKLAYCPTFGSLVLLGEALSPTSQKGWSRPIKG